jgi:hypothetical protein
VTVLMTDYLAGELGSDTGLDFEVHLRACGDCRAFLRTYRKSTEGLESLGYADISRQTVVRIHRFLRERTRRISLCP